MAYEPITNQDDPASDDDRTVSDVVTRYLTRDGYQVRLPVTAKAEVPRLLSVLDDEVERAVG